MQCRPNTHRPSFHVNMVGLEKTQRSNSSRYPWDLDAEMMDEDEEEFELWLQQALASGLFCETSKRRKSWSPFKLPQKKGKKQWRRTSTWIDSHHKQKNGTAFSCLCCGVIGLDQDHLFQVKECDLVIWESRKQKKTWVLPEFWSNFQLCNWQLPSLHHLTFHSMSEYPTPKEEKN